MLQLMCFRYLLLSYLMGDMSVRWQTFLIVLFVACGLFLISNYVTFVAFLKTISSIPALQVLFRVLNFVIIRPIELQALAEDVDVTRIQKYSGINLILAKANFFLSNFRNSIDLFGTYQVQSDVELALELMHEIELTFQGLTFAY